MKFFNWKTISEKSSQLPVTFREKLYFYFYRINKYSDLIDRNIFILEISLNKISNLKSNRAKEKSSYKNKNFFIRNRFDPRSNNLTQDKNTRVITTFLVVKKKKKKRKKRKEKGIQRPERAIRVAASDSRKRTKTL